MKFKLNQLGGTKPNIVIKEKSNKRNPIKKLIELNEKFQNKIPELYLDFLKKNGAISFISDIKIKALENIPISDNGFVNVDNFYDLATDDEACIINVIKNFEDNLPSNLLPICDGEAGDLIVINMSNENLGKIFYWFHDNNKIYLLADNFKDFINKLIVNKEDEVDVKDVKVKKVSNKFLERLKKSGLGAN